MSDQLTPAAVRAMPAGRELDRLLAEWLFARTGVGYYGPPADPAEEWSHDKSVRHDTPEQAVAAYRVYHDARHGPAGRPGYMKPKDFEPSLCYWQDGWGPRLVDEYSEYIKDTMDALCAALNLSEIPPGNFAVKGRGVEYECELTLTGLGVFSATGDTIALAVARACLLATLEVPHGQ